MKTDVREISILEITILVIGRWSEDKVYNAFDGIDRVADEGRLWLAETDKGHKLGVSSKVVAMVDPREVPEKEKEHLKFRVYGDVDSALKACVGMWGGIDMVVDLRKDPQEIKEGFEKAVKVVQEVSDRGWSSHDSAINPPSPGLRVYWFDQDRIEGEIPQKEDHWVKLVDGSFVEALKRVLAFRLYLG